MAGSQSRTYHSRPRRMYGTRSPTEPWSTEIVGTRVNSAARSMRLRLGPPATTDGPRRRKQMPKVTDGCHNPSRCPTRSFEVRQLIAFAARGTVGPADAVPARLSVTGGGSAVYSTSAGLLRAGRRKVQYFDELSAQPLGRESLGHGLGRHPHLRVTARIRQNSCHRLTQPLSNCIA